MQQEIFFSLAGMKIQKMNMHISKKKRKFEEKVIKKDEQFLNIYRPVMNGMQSNLHEPTHTSTSIYLCKLPLHLQNFI